MYGEIGVLPPNDRLLAAAIRDGILAGYGDRLVSLAIFGSVARGAATSKSDIDILIVAGNLVRGRMSRIREYIETENRNIKPNLTQRPPLISPVIKTPDEVSLGSPLFWDMTRDVIFLFDRGDFLRMSLEGVKERLTRLKARRVVKGDGWYWILKGDYSPGETFEI